MGAEQSSCSNTLPWRKKSPYEINLFWTLFPRAVALVSSVTSAYMRDRFYIPVLFKKLNVVDSRYVNYPAVLINDAHAFWAHEGVLDKKVPSVISANIQKKKVKHYISIILRWSPGKASGREGDHVQVQWIDSSNISTHTDQKKFKKLLKARVGPDVDIEMDTVSATCPKVQHFSQTCGLWSLLLVAISMCDGSTTTGEALMKSKSLREFSNEFRAFVAWLHDDVMEGKLLQEQVFFPEECDKKLIDRAILNDIAVASLHKTVISGKIPECEDLMFDTLSIWAANHRDDPNMNWLFEVCAEIQTQMRLPIESLPKFALLMHDYTDSFYSFIELIGSDVWDPHFDHVTETQPQPESCCVKCGQHYCMSTSSSTCYDNTKPLPRPLVYWNHAFTDEQDKINVWIRFINDINPKFANSIEMYCGNQVHS
jgi:hypothetical protein